MFEFFASLFVLSMVAGVVSLVRGNAGSPSGSPGASGVEGTRADATAWGDGPLGEPSASYFDTEEHELLEGSRLSAGSAREPYVATDEYDD